jgi:hypothetical protein
MEKLNNNSKIKKIKKSGKSKKNSKNERINKFKSQVNKIQNRINKVQPSNNTPDYYETILNLPRSITLGHFPLYNTIPTHVCKRKGVFTYPVNASGNIFIELNPSMFSVTGIGSTYSKSNIVLNNVGYTDINKTNYSFTSGSNLTDVNMCSTLGLDPDSFHNALVTGFHVKISATGVSTGNRAGFLTLVEYVDDNTLQIDNSNANSYSALSSYINKRPMKYQIQNPQTLERDLATAYSNSFEYTWIPNFGEQAAYLYDGDVSVLSSYGGVGDSSSDYKKLAIYVNGANVSTQIRLDITLMYQATPTAQHINTYPVSYGTDFSSPNVKLQKLGQNRNIIFREVEDSGMHAYIGGVVTGSKHSGNKVAIEGANFYNQ